MNRRPKKHVKASRAKRLVVQDEWMQEGRDKGPDHLTPTQRQLLAFVAQRQIADGPMALTKREMAEYLGKCEKTVDRLVSDLKHRKLLESFPRYTDKGGQISNAYRVTAKAREKYPRLFIPADRNSNQQI